MEFNYIVNPNSGKKSSIYSKTGKKILFNYVKYLDKFGGNKRKYKKKRTNFKNIGGANITAAGVAAATGTISAPVIVSVIAVPLSSSPVPLNVKPEFIPIGLPLTVPSLDE